MQRSRALAGDAPGPDAGVHLAFFSGNEVFWKTRWTNGHRTLVCFKETHANAKIDPEPATWTGTWRDPRAFNPEGGRPENALTGTIFTVNCCTTDMEVDGVDGQMRFWRNTNIATQPSGGSVNSSALQSLAPPEPDLQNVVGDPVSADHLGGVS